MYKCSFIQNSIITNYIIYIDLYCFNKQSMGEYDWPVRVPKGYGSALIVLYTIVDCRLQIGLCSAAEFQDCVLLFGQCPYHLLK